MTLLVDYAWTVPSAASIRTAGYSGAMRYLSADSSKNLSARERDALLADGLSIGLVWELGGARAGQGYAAGQADGRSATAQANALGYPKMCPIFFAVDDGGLTAAGVSLYFAGVRSTCGYPVGVYGSANVVESTAGWKWQTSAWSAGRVSPHAHLYQRQHTTVAHPLSGTDENAICLPFPLWSKTMPKPTPTPPAPPPTHNVHQTMLIQQAVHVAADGSWGVITMTATNAVIRRSLSNVAYLQARVGAVVDGRWGPNSEAARVHTVALIQTAIGVAPDGVWGPLSQAAWNVAVTNNYGK